MLLADINEDGGVSDNTYWREEPGNVFYESIYLQIPSIFQPFHFMIGVSGGFF